ncbi:DUF2997 domain-containing protein [Leptolyngbya sp. FACHB-261]|uniref:DUF2997 domain-containing protein n=1 Tax=Leptolyngbya sp. FACHB-261 TaxID=2692806 RepID=UPI0016896593|nr:DUF2997 domain-containing protein [Leptolyngbya sp. FACHB-261]MBD2099360.1 DUF2997 domain-containing protein [Leptolyngbya sp. FACHB-261]
METLEFIIHPDGRVEERVTGIVGNSCTGVTAAIEAKLGSVTVCELTSEHFAQVINSGAQDTVSTQVSQW